MRRGAYLCTPAAIALLGLGLPGTAVASGAYPDAVGGNGGAPFEDKCRPGDYLIGFDYWAGKALDGIQPKCMALRDGKWAGGSYSGKTWGSAPRSRVGFFKIDAVDRSVTCPRNQFVTSLHVWTDKFGIVHHFRMNCHSKSRSAKSSHTTSNDGGQPNNDRGVSCPTSMLAFGVHGRHGALIDSIGPICRDP